ncbi:type II toxin-antitoxin system RelE/ParE family toxin [Butyrivibrio sp. AE3004]|uniref:type II toxin-antitoxin system RelE/ParE family toxin n=1 Tax=Butyrivibrio sp. AE3004 TaxID=1506994 RepID=UPI0004942F36|nr:type II toxin-antitoxin system RelE/ParE family toxin [Butyrivibrio sp. AE3004]
MDYEIVYSPMALADMDQTWDEVSADFGIADKYIADLRANLKKVSKRPKTGERLYYEDVFTGIYYVTHKKYSAFYRIRSDRIEVGRVLYNRSAYISLVIKSMSEE